MLKIASFATVLALTATASMAGGYVTPVVERPVPKPVVAVEETNWSGAYVGLQAGKGRDSREGNIDSADTTYGAFAGYRRDFGTVVAGVEADYKTADSNDLNGATLKAQLGYDAGRFLPYVTAGYTRLDVIGHRYETPVFGVGVDVKATENVLVGLEYLNGRVDELDTNIDTLNARVGWHF